MNIAFSTVACPEWPVDRVIAMAEELGYDGIELRTFGEASTRFACDPALTDSSKLRELLTGAAVDVSCVATGLSFDEPVWPPIIGRVRDYEKPIREARWDLRRAAEFGGHQLRVFGFRLQDGEKHANGVRRVRDRLKLVVAAARNTTVRVVIENGGSFATSEQLGELIDGLDTRFVGAMYNTATARLAGEDPVKGLKTLGRLALNVKIKDLDDEGRPVMLGEGGPDSEAVVRHLDTTGYAGWLTFEWDRAWFDGLAGPEGALSQAIRRIYGWRRGMAAKKAIPEPEETETATA